MPAGAAVVRPAVYDSWRRCRLQGLSPHRVVTARPAGFDPDTPLCRIADGVVLSRISVLDEMACALVLTDQRGVVVRRWGSDRWFADRLDAAGVVPGFSVAEEHFGTSSAIALLNESPMLVRGPEHFLDQLRNFSCAGAPIRNPVTRRIVGTLDLACRLADTNPLMLSWVTDLATDIGRALGRAATEREHMLLESYLAQKKDSRQPLITLGPSTIITNPAAARLISADDQAPLWERARHAATTPSPMRDVLTLANGTTVSIDATPVLDGIDMVGAVLKLTPRRDAATRRPDREPPGILAELKGRSEAWRRLAADADSLPAQWRRVLVVGEAGSGRTTIARALLGRRDVECLDAAEPGIDHHRWLQHIVATTSPSIGLVIRNVDTLSPALAVEIARELKRHGVGRIVATAGLPQLGDPVAGNPVEATFPHVLTVPPLRDRLDDLGLLIEQIANNLTTGDAVVHWMPDLVQALARLDWPGNIAELQSLVQRLLPRASSGYVGAADLPSDVLARATRRKLAGLEQGEVQMIMRALKAAGGNKQQAAAALGIARSTLYRKVRALGLDLNNSSY